MAVKSQLLLVLIVDSGGFSWSSDIRGSKKEISVSGRGVPRAESTSPGSVSSVSSYEFRLMLSGSWGKFHTPSSSSSPFLNALINGLYIFFISPDQVKIQMYVQFYQALFQSPKNYSKIKHRVLPTFNLLFWLVCYSFTRGGTIYFLPSILIGRCGWWPIIWPYSFVIGQNI